MTIINGRKEQPQLTILPVCFYDIEIPSNDPYEANGIRFAYAFSEHRVYSQIFLEVAGGCGHGGSSPYQPTDWDHINATARKYRKTGKKFRMVGPLEHEVWERVQDDMEANSDRPQGYLDFLKFVESQPGYEMRESPTESDLQERARKETAGLAAWVLGSPSSNPGICLVYDTEEDALIGHTSFPYHKVSFPVSAYESREEMVRAVLAFITRIKDRMTDRSKNFTIDDYIRELDERKRKIQQLLDNGETAGKNRRANDSSDDVSCVADSL